ncbi:thioredoxin family protein [Listeria ivanovii]|uniref:Thioredoxin family protein n=2 Tax=Listeria ivanovii TaxID=1638 RepID=A0ABS1G546_LISIV|nr:thioredoxin family protein [Listeria ivanovii]EFR96758.1 thioredoxin family protein [Listeria ivanovii FSL F6-596]AIS60013.1 thioredoxin [Listeria ivanovii subsp. londoniensis]AIS62838.1 thioredoxin [Listeria ivanovii subsp. londoniensis]MBC2256069.1 thioredoxin family protein [Listeria ivanovii]MBK1961870.1 thioredoxin family protein [Listeria ivanovii subsp. londoniensis]
MKNLESIEQFNAIKVEGKSVFMFSADWCGDCKYIEPVMPEIEVENEDFAFYHVDRDAFIDLCADLGVFGIPSFLVFEDGMEVGRFVSKDRKTKEEINDFLAAI